MRYIHAVLLVVSMVLAGCNSAAERPEGEDAMSDKELIVLAAPRTGDPYYADMAQNIIDFQIAYAKQAAKSDNVLILADSGAYSQYASALSETRVLVAPMEDIWMRDFGLSNDEAPVMFRYTAAGQGGGRKGQGDADAVQETLAYLIDDAKLIYQESDFLNDGGNFVSDNHGRAVLSRKFLRDNNLDEASARTALKTLVNAGHIAFIEADEQGGLEHADGVVAFIGPNTLVINSYPDDDGYAASLRADLEAGLPGVTIHEIVTPYEGSEIYDERFGSACGLYTNMLVTPNRIYFPQFNIAEDAEALAQLKQWTDKEIIPVMSDQVCKMGGGVRCMSWQLRGENAARLLALTKQSSSQ